MRRRLAAIAAAAAIVIAGGAALTSGGSSPKGHLWITHQKLHTFGVCISTDCGPYAAQLHWSLAPWAHTTTGYFVYVNDTTLGNQADDVANSPWVVPGGDCGTTVTLGVRQHDAGGVDVGPLYTTTYTTPSCSGTTASLFIAQSAAGLGDGSSCANAKAVSFFNTSTNWGTGNPIAPGTVVGLCGTITNSLTAQGSGTTGNPITVLWETGAKISEPFCPSTGCVDVHNRSNIVLDGGSNGIVEANANGSLLANHVTSSLGIQADPCQACTIKNLTVQNIYVNVANNANFGSNDDGIYIAGSNDTVQNVTLHDCHWCMYLEDQGSNGDGNDNFSNLTIYNQCHGFILGANPTGLTSLGPFYIHDSHVTDDGNWYTAGGSCHNDGIHCFTGSTASPPSSISGGLYEYNNRFDTTASDVSTAITSTGIFNEGGSTCTTATSPVYIFNNVVIGYAHGSGLIGAYTGAMHVYNNTMVIPSGTSGEVAFSSNTPSKISAMDFNNNLMDGGGGGNRMMEMGSATTGSFTATSPDFNMYSNFTTASIGGWQCGGSTITSFTTWKSCVGNAGDAHSINPASSSLNSDGSPQAGSPALSAGTNLTSVCSGQPTPGLGALCANINGTTRPTSGAWNIGAF